MASHLCVTVRLLHSEFHGRGQDDQPEWPPSPLRIFQSLVAAASLGQPRWSRDRVRAFETLSVERLERAPILIAPPCVTGDGYRLSVPNNSMDKVAVAWSRENYFGKGDASPAQHRTMKRVCPTYVPEDAEIHCVWPMVSANAEDRTLIDELRWAARRVTSLGWGVDMAIGDARVINDEELNALYGERWLPVRLNTEGGLGVPIVGTVNDLERRHQQFLERIGPDGLRPPEPLSVFSRIEYRRASDPAPRGVACFTLLRPEGGFRAFDPERNTIRVAGMLRNAAKLAADDAGGWPDPASFVLGHAEKPGEPHKSVNNRRFAYLPLPSIQPRGAGRSVVVGSIRRACVTVLESDHEEEIEWARRTLAGRELVNEKSGHSAAVLAPASEKDPALRRYFDPASDWACVSPIVLPGYDDPAHYRRRLRKGAIGVQEQRRLLEALHRRVDRLLRKSIRDAGFPEELAAHADLDWRTAGFWPGTARASDYAVPSHLTRFPRLHVRLKWRDASGRPVRVAGPIVLGGGRFYGIGLFAAV